MQELIVWQLEYLSDLMLGVTRRTCSYVTRKATDAPNVTRMSAVPLSVSPVFVLVVSFQATSSTLCILLLSPSPQTSPLLSPYRAFAKVGASIGTIR